MLKKIKSNTIMFIIIVAFVKIFETIFTPSNTLLGVTAIIAILVLLRENLTENPIKNLFILIAINLTTGIFTHFSGQNMYLGLFLNFIALSSIGYLFSFELNKTMVVPFGLQYLFMLYVPVENAELGKRLLALVVTALLVMVVQFIVHRKNKEVNIPPSQLIKFNPDKEISKIHPIRASYAIRIGLVTAISAFVVSYFKIEQGRWIVYTVFSLTELYSEHCKVRSKQRMQGTIIGAMVILVLFMFIKSDVLRILIMLTAGYTDSYLTNYRDKMICVTISAVASVALTNATFITAIERIVCVFIGVILALIVDKFVLTSNLTDEQENQIDIVSS